MNSATLTLGAITDERLARRGDTASFSQLYERHLPAVFRYVSGRVRTREEAEDLTSEVFRRRSPAAARGGRT